MNCGRCNKNLRWSNNVPIRSQIKVMCFDCSDYYIERYIRIKKEHNMDWKLS